MRVSQGQNLVEFAILSALVVIGLIMCYAFLGDNIKLMLGLSTSKVQKFEPFGKGAGINEGSSVDMNDPNPSGTVEDRLPGTSPDGLEISYGEEGDANFTVGAQQVQLSRETLNSIGSVFQTSGSDGIETYVADAIAEMIGEYADQFPDNNVPIDISFGGSERTVELGILKNVDASINDETLTVADAGKDSTSSEIILGSSDKVQFSGDAEVNQITIAIDLGDQTKYIILVNDHSLADGMDKYKSEMGVYQITGFADSSGQFSGEVTKLDEKSNETKSVINNCNITGNIDDDGLDLSIKKPLVVAAKKDTDYHVASIVGDWQIKIPST